MSSSRTQQASESLSQAEKSRVEDLVAEAVSETVSTGRGSTSNESVAYVSGRQATFTITTDPAGKVTVVDQASGKVLVNGTFQTGYVLVPRP